MSDNIRISVNEVWKRMSSGEEFLFLDTRNPQAWGQSDVKLPRALRVPADEVAQHITSIPKDKPIVAYCT